MKPLIGITGNEDDNSGVVMLKEYYIKSIQAAGGLPVILPPAFDQDVINEYLLFCRGVLFSGGGDIDPGWWGRNPSSELGTINPVRDYFEIQMAGQALQRGIPVLGICRGCQVMNVAAGGSLIQDLPPGFQHDQNAPRNFPSHVIFIENETGLSFIIEEESIKVNSFHHQAVKHPGKGLRCSAYAPDGTIEAIEATEHPFYIGIQWHAECLQDKTSEILFKAFINAADEMNPGVGESAS